MRIRIYYRPDAHWVDIGIITGIVVINDGDWNLAEVIKDKDDNYATFELTEENIGKYMESADTVNLETIQEVQGVL